MNFVRAVTVFVCSISFRCKNSASAFPPQLPLLHICDPAGVGITAMWRSRIADRYNAPRSVSRVRAGFRDDCVGGVCGKKLPQCCLPLLALRSLKTLRALSLGKNKRAVMCVEIADSCLRNTPRRGLGCDLLYCKGNPPQKIMLKNTIGV